MGFSDSMKLLSNEMITLYIREEIEPCEADHLYESLH